MGGSGVGGFRMEGLEMNSKLLGSAVFVSSGEKVASPLSEEGFIQEPWKVNHQILVSFVVKNSQPQRTQRAQSVHGKY